MSLLRIYSDTQEARQTILRRLPPDETPPAQVREGLKRIFGEAIAPEEAVRRILADVRARGDQAALDWTERIDGMRLEKLEVAPEQMQAAKAAIPADLLEAMEAAAARIRAFHERQPKQSWMDLKMGGTLGQIVRPLDRVGIYAPAGTAPLPSSLLMSAIPARVAGVGEIVVMTPPQRKTGEASPLVLAAAAIAGVDRLFTLGGAQAIGALAYGTASVPRVDKICGPGNLFVTLAKRQVYGWVGIDGLPGPTETLIIADEVADAERVAADLLAQAEHDVMASAILLTPSAALAGRVQAAVERQFAALSRQSIMSVSLVERSGIVLVRDAPEAIALANEYAPEHLCLDVADPWQYLSQIRHAGGIFLGGMSCEVLGDYVAGPSHIMPTSGTARFASPQNVWDFCKITSLIALSAEEAGKLAPAAARFAEAEGLDAHAAAARLRAK
jgi:histidinol dehydrogenase